MVGGSYSTKLGYEALFGPQINDESWWWKKLSKFLNILLKQFYLCGSLNNKVSTSEISRKRNEGPHICLLSRRIKEIILHLFLYYTYSQPIRRDLEHHSGFTKLWNMDTIVLLLLMVLHHELESFSYASILGPLGNSVGTSLTQFYLKVFSIKLILKS